MHLKIFTILALLAAIPWAPASSLSLESLVQTALANNRDLQAARFAVFKSKGRLAQAGKWINPELELSGMSDVVFANDRAGAFTIGLYQHLPMTARLSLSRESARVDILRAIREIRNHERLLIAEVRSTSVRILQAEARARALDSLLTDANKTASLAEERLGAGQGSLAEKGLALVDQRLIANELASARLDGALATMKLKTLLGLEAKTPLRISESLSGAIEKLSRVVTPTPTTIHRPDVDLLALEEEKATIEIALARAEAWEGIRIGIEYTYDRNIDAPEGLGTDHFLGLSVSIPLPLWDQNKGLMEERSAMRDESRARLRAATLEMENALASSLHRVNLLESRLAIFDRETLPPVESALKDMSEGFQTGLVDLRDLLTLSQQLGELRLERIALQGRLANALAELESTTGAHPAIRRNYLTLETSTKTQ